MKSENSVFHFRKFSVRHENTAMKVGTDGVLLGAWADAEDPGNILDVGAGTGIIGLMLAQRFPQADIICLEPDNGAQLDLEHNLAQSPFSSRLHSVKSNLQDFKADRTFDLIVSNPPFFNSGNAAVGPRGDARHSHGLSHAELLESAGKLLSSTGRVSLILPFQEGGELLDMAPQKGFYLLRHCIVYPNREQAPVRRLLEFSRQINSVQHSTLFIREGKEYSDSYRDLTKEFYLNIM